MKLTGLALVTQPPPIITQGPANQTLPLKSLAILPCKAVGHSTPVISWKKNGNNLNERDEDSARFTQLTTGALQIHDLQKEDSGIYTCVAKNQDGESSWSANLLVEAHTDPLVIFHRMPEPATFPSAPSKPRILNISETTVELSWQPPNKQGASGVTGYILEYFSPESGQTWQRINELIREPRYLVRDLRSASSFIFLIRAENSHGIGEPSAMSAIVRTNGSVLLEPRQLDFELDLARKRLGEEQLVKLLEVKTVNSTAMKLFWRVNSKFEFIDNGASSTKFST